MIDLSMPVGLMPPDRYTGRRVVMTGPRGGLRGRIDGALWRGHGWDRRSGWLLHVVWQTGTQSLLHERGPWRELRC
jgi:hypothetical protein